jgi:hypothetical protein
MHVHSRERAGAASNRTAEAPAEQKLADAGIGGWAAQRLAVVEQADGMCALRAHWR